MAISTEDFRKAVHYITSHGGLTVTGQRFIDGYAQKVYDETHDPVTGSRIGRVDITPDETTLNQALIDLATQQNLEQQQETIRAGAKTDVSNIPNYATFTAAEAEAFINTNVTDLASAKTVLVALAKMVIALRNKEWPDLEGSA